MERKRSFRRRQKPPFAERAKDHCRKFTAFMFSNVGIILLVVLYTIAGAFMFIAIEGGGDEERAHKTTKHRDELVQRLWTITSDLNVFNKTQFKDLVGRELQTFQESIVTAAKGGLTEVAKTKSGKKWTFSGAFLYSLTIITTIGYGNVSPRTQWGKVATILYAIIGMPLFLLYLSNIGDILAKSFKWIYAKVFLCRICPGVTRRRALRERRKEKARIIEPYLDPNITDESSLATISHSTGTELDTDLDEIVDTQTVTVPLTTCVMIMIGYLLFGAALFGRWETWDLLDGSYFCFISLSSIGFGDFVPGDKITGQEDEGLEMSFILCAIYLLLGMALIAMCFSLMQEQVIHKIRNFKRAIRMCFRCRR